MRRAIVEIAMLAMCDPQEDVPLRCAIALALLRDDHHAKE